MKKKLLYVLCIIVSCFSLKVYAAPMRAIYVGNEETITSPTYNVSTGEMQYYTVESSDPEYLRAEKIKINGVCASFDNCNHSIDFKVTAVSKGSATVYIKDDNGEIVENYFFTVYPGIELPTLIPEDNVYLIAKGDSAYISGYDSDKYTFESANPDIAVISDKKVLTGISEGETEIYSYLPNGGGASIIRVRVYQGAKSLQISGGDKYFYQQNIMEDLEVIFNPTNTTYKDVTWTSSNPNIIDVTPEGHPIVKKNGQARITACTKRDNVCTSITATASNIIEDVKVVNSPTKINVGETKKLEYITTPTVDMTKKDIKWTSFDEKIVTVDKNGNITAKKAGTTSVIMTNNSDSFLVNFDIEVSNPIKSVVTSVKEKTMLIGSTLKIDATINPADTDDDKKLVWDSIDENIATVDQLGNVKAKNQGMTFITVTASNGKSALIKITVKKSLDITSVKINQKSLTVVTGKTGKLTTTINPSNTTQSKTLTWTSSNKKIATVDKNGNVKGIKAGTANITVKTSNGKTATIKVTVKKPTPIKSVKLNKKTLKLELNKTYQLKATINPSSTTDSKVLSWSTSNKKVAIVDKNGKITAVGGGSATITVTTPNKKKAKVKVTVSKINAKKATITAIKDQVQTGKALKPSVQVKLNGKVLKSGTDYTVSYKNNKKAGKATVTVKFKGNYTGSKTSSFIIIPSKVSIKNPSTSKKSITVKYSKVSGAKYYQTAYRIKGSNKWSYTTKSKISKLTSGKEYEVMIRAGIKSGSKTLYGSWSNVKTIKVK